MEKVLEGVYEDSAHSNAAPSTCTQATNVESSGKDSLTKNRMFLFLLEKVVMEF
jgi:hypothetical protein